MNSGQGTRHWTFSILEHGFQLLSLRSGTSIGANYREAFRARSKAEFIAKCGDSLREIEESTYWLELLVESGARETAGRVRGGYGREGIDDAVRRMRRCGGVLFKILIANPDRHLRDSEEKEQS